MVNALYVLGEFNVMVPTLSSVVHDTNEDDERLLLHKDAEKEIRDECLVMTKDVVIFSPLPFFWETGRDGLRQAVHVILESKRFF